MSCIVVGVSGASGSGKTYFTTKLAKQLEASLGPDSVTVIHEDAYYRDQSSIPEADRIHTNYDHPDSLEHELLAKHLATLKAGGKVELPHYDYCRHTRAAETTIVQPTRILLVEGILLFSDAVLRKELDVLVFVDTPLDLCLLRRVDRDMRERGRTFESIATQYAKTVRPMYFEYIEPSKQWADLIVPGWKDVSIALDVLHARLRSSLE